MPGNFDRNKSTFQVATAVWFLGYPQIIGIVSSTSVGELLWWHNRASSPLGEEWVREKWSDPVVVVERLEESPVIFWGGTDKVTICAVLRACSVWARDHSSMVESKVDCLQRELRKEKELTCMLIEVLLAQTEKKKNKPVLSNHGHRP